MRALLGLGLLLGACAYESPFTELGPLSDGDAVRILRERTAFEGSLFAELALDYRDNENSGTFDAVARFDSSGTMEVQAFKDLVVAIEPIFELTFTPERYAMELRGEDGAEPTRDEGRAADFPIEHPNFRGFYWSREAFCLPGSVGERVVVGPAGEADLLSVRSRLSSGASVRWSVDPSTLEVKSAVVSTDDETVGEVRYDRYTRVGDLFVPGRVVFDDSKLGVHITIAVSSVELVPE